MKDNKTCSFENLNKYAIEHILKSIENLKFGNLMITVHNGKIMQVDITEKKRFEETTFYEKGGGI